MKILTVKQVSELLQAKQSTVYAWAEQRLMPSFKINDFGGGGGIFGGGGTFGGGGGGTFGGGGASGSW